MKYPLLSSLTLMFAFASTALAGDLTNAERTALAAQPVTNIASLRAGESEPVPQVAPAERTELARAAASSADLDTLRAGAVSDHDLAVAGVIIGVIVLAIIIF